MRREIDKNSATAEKKKTDVLYTTQLKHTPQRSAHGRLSAAFIPLVSPKQTEHRQQKSRNGLINL
jgi:hypothetical protein